MICAVPQGNPAFIQAIEHPWVGRLQGWCGLQPEVVTYGTNATGYDSDCVKAIMVCGPGDIAQAHMADEWVEVEQLVKFKSILGKWLGLN